MSSLAQLIAISRSYGGVKALDGVSFAVEGGEVHALVGENGAGKSTLMRVLGGETEADTGEIRLNGKTVHLRSPADAIARGVAIIHQEIALAPHLSVAENIFLGELPLGISWRALRARARELISRLGFDIPPDAIIEDLSVAHQQVVEIAKALSRKARIIVFDEPTAVLATRDAERLLEIIRSLKADGVGIVYISHRIDEVFRIADRISVLKDGRNVDTLSPEEVSVEDVIRRMVGRPLQRLFGEKPTTTIGEEVLRIEGLTSGSRVRNVSFSVRAGEIVGLGGLVGSGRTEVARSLFGADPKESGRIYLRGREVSIRSPRQGVALGIALVPEARKDQGLITAMSIKVNATMAHLASVVNRLGFIRRAEENRAVGALVDGLRIKSDSIDAPVSSLSGGNQQKVVLAKWFHLGAEVVLLDEPTRGVDVGAKVEIYSLIHRMAADGKAVVVISSEHLELFGLCDRILVMGDGEIRGELEPDQYSEEAILSLSISRSASQAGLAV